MIRRGPQEIDRETQSITLEQQQESNVIEMQTRLADSRLIIALSPFITQVVTDYPRKINSSEEDIKIWLLGSEHKTKLIVSNLATMFIYHLTAKRKAFFCKILLASSVGAVGFLLQLITSILTYTHHNPFYIRSISGILSGPLISFAILYITFTCIDLYNTFKMEARFSNNACADILKSLMDDTED